MTVAHGDGDQLALLRGAARGRRPRPPEPVAGDLPVARVLVDVPLPHLDRPFDYLVPAGMAETAVPGARVRVRFAGQDVDGFVVERAVASDHQGALAPLRRVVSAEPVLAPEVLALARAVAQRYAGTTSDVLRLAVPPRHARAEAAAPPAVPATVDPGTVDPGPWSAYPAGPALLARLAAGEAPRAVWTALPGPHWAQALATAAAVVLAAGRGSLLVVPDRRDVDAVDAALTARLGPGRHVRLEADLGPAARYRAFLALRRGAVQVVVGTRAAVFAPVRRLGLVAIWDDGDDLHLEPRSPYPHAREVLALRSRLEGTALLAGAWSRSAECAAWVRHGWARPVTAPREVLRQRWATVAVAGTEPGAGDDPAARARLPGPAWRVLRDGLAAGPVLVQVPRAGYLPGLACRRCRRPARCTACQGPLGFPIGPSTGGEGEAGSPVCRWCGRVHPSWECRHCGDSRLRATSVGVARTAEELGRAFPGAPVVVPRPGAQTPAVPGGALVVATPGLEPPVEHGYAAAVLLDAALLLERPDLRATEDALRRWLAAAAAVRPAAEGGRVVVCADPAAPAVQALVRLDPAGFADRELDERAELGFPPAVALVVATGPPAAVASWTAAVGAPEGVEVLGPVPTGPPPGGPPTPAEGPAGAPVGEVRVLLRAPLAARAGLAAAARAASAGRSARREAGAVRVQVDPHDVG